MKINKTKNYDLFGFFPQNRAPNHVPKIRASIEDRDLTQYVPILVTEHEGILKIIDGQNRFLACKELNKPIFYINAPGLSSEDMITLNTNQENWSPLQYLNHYCQLRNVNYLRFKEVFRSTRLTINFMTSACLTTEDRVAIFKKGRMVFDEKEAKMLKHINKIYAQMIESTRTQHPCKSLASAIKEFIRIDGYNDDRMKSKIKKFPYLINREGNLEGYKRMIEELYNHHQTEKIYFPKK